MPDEPKKKQLSLDEIPADFVEQFIWAYVNIKKGETEKEEKYRDITPILDELRDAAIQLKSPLERDYWMKAIDNYGQFKQLTREELLVQGAADDT